MRAASPWMQEESDWDQEQMHKQWLQMMVRIKILIQEPLLQEAQLRLVATAAIFTSFLSLPQLYLVYSK